jgi:L-ascorbate metabolism protein UlaG (beta-lactamase superfamily)
VEDEVLVEQSRAGVTASFASSRRSRVLGRPAPRMPAAGAAVGGSITWLGHSCAAIRLDGLLVVTDPVLRRRVLHLRRKQPVDPAALDGISAILLSHVHHDHLDLPSLDRFDRALPVVAPVRAGDLLRRRGFRIVREVVPGDVVDLGALRIRATHAEHGSPWRLGAGRTEPVGYVIAGTRTVYFAGDTDVFEGMRALGPIDVALLPVSGWGPRLPPGHLDPLKAAEALDLIQPHVAIPIHWGTYAPWRPPTRNDAPAKAFAEIAATVAPTVDVRILRPGQSYELD